MKRKTKRCLITLLAVLIMIGILAGCSGCNPDPVGPGPKDPETINITILSDLVDLGVNLSDYAPSAAVYGNDVKTQQAQKLLTKQESEKEKHNYIDTDSDGVLDTNFDQATNKYAWDDVYYDADNGVYVWEDDGDDAETTTFTKIFLFADVDQIITRMAAAGLAQDKMIKVVSYITREDPAKVDGVYSLASGTGSAIRDYEELDELYDIYDEDDSDANYILLQKKRRKVMHEVFGIFENDAAAAARTGVEILSYAQKVVAETMITDYETRTGDDTDFYGFFKGELFDYDSLVYFLAFNETCGATTGNDYLIDNVSFTIAANNKKDIVKLYGYYYQYEKREFDLFTDDQYFDYLDLGTKDYFDTDADALRYRDYDRTHYTGAYRYSSTFYKKYYDSHLRFQYKQEQHDIRVYGFSPDWTTRYSTEMQSGCDVGMEATLKVSDVNWKYTEKDSNVTNYNKAAKAYYTINEADRDDEKPAANIALVHLQIEQLKSQHYTVTHKYLTSDDLGNALKYQIYSFSADYSRTMLANRKDDVYFNAELDKLVDADEVADKEEEIGRNEAMQANHIYFYKTNGNVAHQLEVALNHDWVKIAQEMADTLAYDYDTYHQKQQQGIPFEDIGGVRVYYTDPVTDKFEDTLIKKKTVDDSGNGSNTKEEYDTEHRISRLLDNHENVFRYAYGQITVEYRAPSDITNYTLKGQYTSTDWPDAGITNPDSSALSAPGVQAISTSNRECFSEEVSPGNFVYHLATNYSYYEEETFDTDENIELARFIGSKWEGILPQNNGDSDVVVQTFEKVEDNQITYEYRLIFEGWFVDSDLQYKAKFDGNTRFGEEFDYDIRLYAGFKVLKINRGKK